MVNFVKNKQHEALGPVESVESKRTRFLEAYEESNGFFWGAVQKSGIFPQEIHELFTQEELDDMDRLMKLIRDDFAENALMNLIEAGDPSAIIFYCSTKLKGKGYKK